MSLPMMEYGNASGALLAAAGLAMTADSTGINTSETILVQSNPLSANLLAAGTVIRATLYGACTTTVSNATTFNVRIGTAGTTSDTAVTTYSTAGSGTTGTGIPFCIRLSTTIRTVGASATSTGNIEIYTKVNTGIVTQINLVDTTGAGTAFNTTTNNLIISVSTVTAATTTTNTFKQAYIEFF